MSKDNLVLTLNALYVNRKTSIFIVTLSMILSIFVAFSVKDKYESSAIFDLAYYHYICNGNSSRDGNIRRYFVGTPEEYAKKIKFYLSKKSTLATEPLIYEAYAISGNGKNQVGIVEVKGFYNSINDAKIAIKKVFAVFEKFSLLNGQHKEEFENKGRYSPAQPASSEPIPKLTDLNFYNEFTGIDRLDIDNCQVDFSEPKLVGITHTKVNHSSKQLVIILGALMASVIFSLMLSILAQYIKRNRKIITSSNID